MRKIWKAIIDLWNEAKYMWRTFVKRFIVDIEPGVKELQADIDYLWDSIEVAEHYHEFVIIESEIERFKGKFKVYGFSDFNEVVAQIEDALSARKDEVQRLFAV